LTRIKASKCKRRVFFGKRTNKKLASWPHVLIERMRMMKNEGRKTGGGLLYSFGASSPLKLPNTNPN